MTITSESGGKKTNSTIIKDSKQARMDSQASSPRHTTAYLQVLETS